MMYALTSFCFLVMFGALGRRLQELDLREWSHGMEHGRDWLERGRSPEDWIERHCPDVHRDWQTAVDARPAGLFGALGEDLSGLHFSDRARAIAALRLSKLQTEPSRNGWYLLGVLEGLGIVALKPS